MASTIIPISAISPSKLTFGIPKVLDSGGKSVSVQMNSRNIRIELPSMKVPFGVNLYDKNGPPKYSLDLSIQGEDDNPQIAELKAWLEAMDERAIDVALENARAWFKMPTATRETIAAFYTRMVKYAIDSDGNRKPYPPTFKINLRGQKGKKPDGTVGLFEASVYNGIERTDTGAPTPYDSATRLDSVICKHGYVTVIPECTGLWMVGSKFGWTWKAMQVRVDSTVEELRGPAFRSEAPEIRSFVAKTATGGASRAATAAAAVPAIREVTGETEGDEDEGELLIPAFTAVAIAPPPVAAATTTVAVPTYDEEAVAEPIPVPAKKPTTVIKKVVRKA